MLDDQAEERPESGAGMTRGIVATWARVVTDPHAFLADMPETGGLREPGLYLLVCILAAALGWMLRTFSPGFALWFVVVEVIDAFVLAGLIVLAAQHLFDGRAGFEPTFRVVAYAWSPLVFSWVPIIGGIGILYAGYIAVRGVERVHRIDTLRAVLSVVLAVAGVFVLRAIA